MRNAISSFIAISALAAACGGEDPPQLVDAPAGKEDAAKQDAAVDSPPAVDTSCATNPAPTTATAQVILSGAANSVEHAGGLTLPTFAAMPEAPIKACVDDCTGANSLDTTQSAMAPCPQTGCAFATDPLTTGGVPLDGYLSVSKATYRTTHIFPSEPVRANLMNIPALVLSTNAFTFISGIAQVQQNDNTNGVLAVVVTDCALSAVEGASLSLTKNGNPVNGTTVVDAGQFAATLGIPQLAGTFFVFNVPPGVVTVGATVGGTMFRAHDVQVFVGQTSATQVTPGFAAP